MTFPQIRERIIRDGRKSYFEEMEQSRPRPSIASSSRGWTSEEMLVVELLRGVDHKGSDVRLSTGQLISPSCWPRVPIDPGFWNWQLAMKWRWSGPEHINVLEARAALTAAKWRMRRSAGIGSKHLNLMDSFVGIAVLSKRRSSSDLLNCVCRRMGALELGSSSHALYGFCRSDQNPADEWSRC